nr:hypothetical protein [Tanacetum cinerariifolium]
MYQNGGVRPTDDLIENLTKTVTILVQFYNAHLPQTNNQLRTSSSIKNQATVQNGSVVVQYVQGRQNRGQRNHAKGAVAARNGGVHNIFINANPGQANPIKCYNYNGIEYIARQCTHPKRQQKSKYFKDKMMLMQVRENKVVLDEEQLFIAADHCDAFDSVVVEAPIAQTMFMANLSSADSIYDEVGLSYDSDILYEVLKQTMARSGNGLEDG